MSVTLQSFYSFHDLFVQQESFSFPLAQSFLFYYSINSLKIYQVHSPPQGTLKTTQINHLQFLINFSRSFGLCHEKGLHSNI